MGGQAKGKKKNKPKRKDNRPNKGNFPSAVVRCPATGSNTDLLEVYNYILSKGTDRGVRNTQFPNFMADKQHFLGSQDAGFGGLSPQERMKVRMHEKAKKKTSEKYTVLQLLEKVTWKKRIVSYCPECCHQPLGSCVTCDADRRIHGHV